MDYIKSLLSREAELESFYSNGFAQLYENAKRISFSGRDGVRLGGFVFRAKEEKAAIALVLGRTESVFKYVELIYDLGNLGFTVYTYDHRGQGESQRIAKDLHIGHVAVFQDYVDDFSEFFEKVVRPQTSVPVFLLAHSMGCAVAAQLLLNKSLPLKGVCFSAPMFEINFGKLPSTVAYGLVSAACRLGLGEAYAPSTGPIDLENYGYDLSSSDVRLKYIRTTLKNNSQYAIGGPSNQWLKTSIEATREIAKSEAWHQWTYPTLLLDALSDQIVMRRAFAALSKISAPFYQVAVPKSQHEIFFEKDAYRIIGIRSLNHFILDHI